HLSFYGHIFLLNCLFLLHPAEHIIPLDMALKSVDDMYQGCNDKMKAKAREVYLPNEKNINSDFTKAWDDAELNYKKKYKKKRRPSTGLEKEQALAIYVYTLEKPNVYVDFNNAVRTQRSEYNTKFTYHALHFFLTDALQALKKKHENCLTVFRRVNTHFSQNVLNMEIRFGSFASSSLGKYPQERFGDKSCFEIETCFGADISLYSKYTESEGEVLIPPYEIFKVIDIKTRSKQKVLPCEVVYKLKSTRTPVSYLNCALFPNKQY
uniref:NAD(P)(+)--arginine ADP-ribosyltransferase n=1 Tax=Mastacembelus armatus TaxID=205130 RepID=A0A3Q3MT06_9TELE